MATVNDSGQGLLSLNVRHLMAWVRWALGRQHLRMIHLIGMDGSLGAEMWQALSVTRDEQESVESMAGRLLVLAVQYV